MKKILDWISKNPLWSLVIFIFLLSSGIVARVVGILKMLIKKPVTSVNNPDEPIASFEGENYSFSSSSTPTIDINDVNGYYVYDVDGVRHKAYRRNGIVYIFDLDSGNWKNLVEAGYVVELDGRIRKLNSSNNENRYKITDFSNVK